MLGFALASLAAALLLGGCVPAAAPIPVQYYEPEPGKRPQRQVPAPAPSPSGAPRDKVGQKLHEIDAAIGIARGRIDKEMTKELTK